MLKQILPILALSTAAHASSVLDLGPGTAQSISGEFASGWSEEGCTATVGYRFDGKSLEFLPMPSRGLSINSSGNVVGDYHTDAGALHGFFWADGKLTDISSGTYVTVAWSLNNSNAVVGYTLVQEPNCTVDCDYVPHAFVWHNGTLTDLNDLLPSGSPTLSYAFGINDHGQICGQMRVGGENHGYVFTP